MFSPEQLNEMRNEIMIMASTEREILFKLLLKCQTFFWYNIQTNLIFLIALKCLQDSMVLAARALISTISVLLGDTAPHNAAVSFSS